MKTNFSLLWFVILFASKIYSQDYKPVKDYILKNQVESAKIEIDKILTDNNAQLKAETWYWKSKVYSLLYKNDKTKHQYGNLESTVDEAFKKYMSLDKEMNLIIQNGGQDIPFNVYQATFSYGVNAFNTKKWDSAAYYFKYAVEYSDIIFANHWASNNAAFDTTAVLYAGYAYQNAKKMDEAYKYYSRLADAKAKGKGFEDAYKFILTTNSNKKDKEAFERYLAIAKEVYPDENWKPFEASFLNNSASVKSHSNLSVKEAMKNIRIETKDKFDGATLYMSEKSPKWSALLNENRILLYIRMPSEESIELHILVVKNESLNILGDYVLMERIQLSTDSYPIDLPYVLSSTDKNGQKVSDYHLTLKYVNKNFDYQLISDLWKVAESKKPMIRISGGGRRFPDLSISSKEQKAMVDVLKLLDALLNEKYR